MYKIRKMLNSDFHKKDLSPKTEQELDNLNSTIEKQEKLIKIFDETPILLQKVGLKNLPVYIPKNKISLCLYSKNSFKHGHMDDIGRKTLKKVLSLLGDPLVISLEEDTFGLYFETKSSKNLPVYLPIRESKDGHRNIILSTYGKVPTNIEEIIYIDNTRFFKRWNETSYRVLGFKKDMEDLLFLKRTLTKTDLLKECEKNDYINRKN